jgi:hypothetical protein
MNRNVYIIGPFNTGTNLIHNIINNCDCIDLTNNMPINIYGENDVFNKHTLNISSINDYLKNNNNLLIILYKNIYNWLYSIKKVCYDIKYTELHLPVELFDKQFPNMIELYNYYYTNYMKILNDYNNVVFLDYEKIIETETSYDYVNTTLSKLNLFISSKPNFDIQLMTPSKSHGNPVESAIIAKQNYLFNRDKFKNLINNDNEDNNDLKKSINQIIFDFYEL